MVSKYLLKISMTEKKSKYNYFKIALFFYHMLFVLTAYYYVINNGGDALKYWLKDIDLNANQWFHFLSFGTDLILFLNYPLVKYFELPLIFGFFLYGVIGYFGVLQFYEFSKKIVGENLVFKGFNLLQIFMFLPSLHFWTSILGKDPIVFWGIATFLNSLISKEKNLKLFLSLFLIVLIRPHVALFLIICFLVPYFIFKFKEISNRLLYVLFTITASVFSTVFLLSISEIENLDYDKAIRYNDHSLKSLEYSNSYIPMKSYSYPEKIFAINFRPLFFDVHNYWGIFVSIENIFLLSLYLAFLFLIVFNLSKIKWNLFMFLIIFYNLLSSIIYVKRYSDLGLLIRTKNMFQPFMVLVIISVFTQVIVNNKLKNETKAH